jgi:probable HAF family extracellular repeat protein
LRNIGRLGIWYASQTVAMNDVGQSAGNAFYGVGERMRGFVHSDADGVLRVIPTLGGDWSLAYAINNSAQVVGVGTVDSTNPFDPVRHGFMYQDGAMQDLGTLGGRSSGYDLNGPARSSASRRRRQSPMRCIPSCIRTG